MANPLSKRYPFTGSDAILGQPRSGGAIISGMQADPDINVAGINNDEFDNTWPTQPQGWLQYGALDAVNVNTFAKSHLYFRTPTDTATTIKYGVYRVPPPYPYTVTCKLSGVNGSTAGFPRAGLALSTATPATASMVYVGKLLGSNSTGMEMWSATTLAAPGIGPVWLRLVALSTTDISTYFSGDGNIWISVGLNQNPAFTIGSVILFARPQNASVKSEALFDWIRFTSP